MANSEQSPPERRPVMRFLKKEIWRKHKKRIILVSAGVAAVAVGCGIWYYMGHNSSFEYVGMTEYWGDSQESNGPVTTDKIQTVFLSDTQTVTEILVKEKDTVKKGDILMTFDTTLSDLQLERKRLDVEKLKLQLESAQKELKRINGMQPMVIPTIEEEPEDTYLGRLIGAEYEISQNKAYDGSSADKAIICWIHSDTEINDALFRAIKAKASEYQKWNQPEEEPPAAEDPTEETTETETTVPDNDSDGDDGSGSSSGTSEASDPPATSFYVVFKVTSGNMSLGDKVIWQCVEAYDNGSHFTFRFVNTVVADHMLVDLGGEDTGDSVYEIDFGSGYTAAQIAQMRSDQQKKIKNLEFQIKIADSEYRIMQTEVTDGNVYAQIDGTVISCLDPQATTA